MALYAFKVKFISQIKTNVKKICRLDTIIEFDNEDLNIDILVLKYITNDISKLKALINITSFSA
jgi:hypothetical protein